MTKERFADACDDYTANVQDLVVKANATVDLAVAAPGGQTAHSSFTVIRDGGARKVDKAASLSLSPAG